MADEKKPLSRSEREAQIKDKAGWVITVIAALLAVNTYVANGISGSVLTNTIKANDIWNFYQAKSIKQSIAEGQMEDAISANNEKRATELKAKIDRYESDPKTGEGKKELMAKAIQLEEDRDAAKKMSVNIGATEFVQVFVDSYKFDAGSRTASFNLNVNRYLSSTGAPVGTVNFKQQGIAAAGTATKLQEAEAVSRAMTVGAEQSVGGLYPASTIVENAKPAKTNKKKGNNWIKPAFILGLLGLYSGTR
jgi:hypothetical protein